MRFAAKLGSLWMFLGIWGFIVIGMCVFIAIVIRRKRQAGAVLLDLGRIKAVMVFWITLGSLSALGGIGSLIDVLADLGRPSSAIFFEVSCVVVLLSGSVLLFFAGLSKWGITENGLFWWFFPVLFLRWDEIESYEWGGKNGHALILRLRRRWGSKEMFSIPPVHKDAVESLLAQYLPTDSDKGDESST